MSLQVIVFELLYIGDTGGGLNNIGIEGLGGGDGLGIGFVGGGGLGLGGDGLGIGFGVGGREGSRKNDPNSPSLHKRLPGTVEPTLQLKGKPTY